MSGAGCRTPASVPILANPSASGDEIFRLVLIAGLAALTLAACGPRPVGDFGRPGPSYAHDVLMPAAGDRLAEGRGEPVSDFNLTDEEEEMHDRVWRFLVAAHARDWSYDFVAELQRTRITPINSRRFGIDRYYRWLRTTEYRSSTVRYATMRRHILADIDTLPGTFAAICAVIEIDRQRTAALRALPRISPAMAAEAAERKAENDMYVGWFISKLNYRYQSYDYALDHLLVETPHEESVAVDHELERLAGFVVRANQYDFCGRGAAGHGYDAPVIPSRFQRLVVDDEVVVRK
jgi:hypothetical protein